MDYKQIIELIKIIDESKLTFFEMETEHGHIKMNKNDGSSKTSIITETIENKEKTQEVSPNVPNISEGINVSEDTDTSFILAPIVGTFYASPSPDEDAFVKVGSKIKKGDVVCILEAMKLMNEIQAEEDCEIVEVLVENEEMVEYGQPLFKVRKVK